jgi:hypothetical protein
MRRDGFYVAGQLLGRLMRHLRELASIEVALVPRRMTNTASLAALISTPRREQRFSARGLRARRPAVAVTVVAEATDEEDLPTPRAAHEA